MKLHLGCGKRILEGYVNCDISSDLRTLPFANESVDVNYE